MSNDLTLQKVDLEKIMTSLVVETYESAFQTPTLEYYE